MINKTKDRTMIKIIVLLICTILFWGWYISAKHEQITTENAKQFVVQDVISLVKDNDILIKNSSFTILYNGSTEELKQEQQLLNKKVKEIAICDDNENTITIFVK